MNPFHYERARDPSSAVALLAGAPGGVFLAGGTNLVDHLRLGVQLRNLVTTGANLLQRTCCVSLSDADGRGHHDQRGGSSLQLSW